MSDRIRRRAVLARIEAGEISPEEAIAELGAVERESGAERDDARSSGRRARTLMRSGDGHEGSVERIVETTDDEGLEDVRVSAGSARPKKAGRVKIDLAGHLGGADSRRLRVRVGDESGKGERLKIDLPVGLAEAGLRLMERIDPDGRWAEHRAVLEGEGEHVFLEVTEADGEHVRISVG